MADDVMVSQNSSGPQDVPGDPGDLHRFAHVIQLGKRDLEGARLFLVQEPAEMIGQQLGFRDL